MQQIIMDETQRGSFSGVVLVQHHGETIYAKGHDLAYRAEARSNTIETRFGTASGTKTFTAVAICQLIEQGKFSFDARLVDCVDVRLPDYDPDVTVRHLLTHTSGIPDYLDEDTMTDADYAALYARFPVYTLRSPADYLPMFPNSEMNFKPGERFRYCNGGYILLALIIEQQSGLAYQQYIEQQVFARAGMTDSGFFEMDCLPERTASGYVYDPHRDVWRTNIFSVPITGNGDGGAFVTAPDMVRFWDALREYRLLSPEMTRAVLTPQIDTDPDDKSRHYGLGVWIITDDAGIPLRYSAIGGDTGVNFISSVLPQHQVHVTIIGNTDGPSWAVHKKIVDAFTG